jgi:hypothetical protein
MNIDIKILEDLADEANAKGDNNLAIVLYTFLGARKTYMENELAVHNQNWARRRSEELKQFKNRKNN